MIINYGIDNTLYRVSYSVVLVYTVSDSNQLSLYVSFS